MNDAHRIAVGNLLRTLPAALEKSSAVHALSESSAEALAMRPEEIDRLLIYPAIDRLDEELLDILAHDFKVDWWDGDYTLEEKRRTLKDSWRVHRMLGTKAAVVTAISAIFPVTDVKEWFEYGGKPYHFKLKIDLSGMQVTFDKQKRVYKKLDYYKNLRSHNDGVTYVTEPKESAVLAFGGVLSTIKRVPIPEAADTYDFQDTMRTGGRNGVITTLPIPQSG